MTHDMPPKKPASGRTRRRIVVVSLLAVGMVGAAAGMGLLKGFLPNPVVAGDPKASGRGDPSSPAGVQTVKVIRPRIDASFRVTSNQLAVVEAFYQAGLRARVSGVVRGVAKDIGDPVRAGELLIDIDVPDLRQAVEQKDAVILQRLQEVRAAEGDAKTAAATVELAKANITQRLADVTQSENLRAAKQKKFDRYKLLGTSVTPDVVDEADLELRAAAAGVQSATAAVLKARAEQTQKEASEESAVADIDLKRALVEVARRDRDAAATLLGYARLYAPFDGIVTHRGAGPGKFVANATTGMSESLITVSRVDLVTVAMKVPDSAAGFITPDTEVFVEFAQLPGVTARGPITRFSPSIDPADRTMRVEVDVYNGTADEFRMLLGRTAADRTLSSLIPADGFAMAVAAGAGMVRSRASHKGWHDGSALPADRSGDGRFRQIVPGTMATVRVSLDNFADARLLPSGAVFNRSGQSYILVVEDEVTKAVPVVVQVNDGRLVKVAMSSTVGGQQVLRELTGNEQIVATRQVEIGDGQRVNAVPSNW